jgi:hypothetical protein
VGLRLRLGQLKLSQLELPLGVTMLRLELLDESLQGREVQVQTV